MNSYYAELMKNATAIERGSVKHDLLCFAACYIFFKLADHRILLYLCFVHSEQVQSRVVV